MKRTLGSVAMVTLMGLALAGCANNGMSRQQSTVGGAVVGGAVGAAVGSDWDKRKY